MSRKIIRPMGRDLIDYLNNGYAICNRCGAVMDRIEEPEGGNDVYICPSCESAVDVMDYEYEQEDDQVEKWTSEVLGAYGGHVPPAGCRACGGPYPYCKTSCKLFDD